jgi:hypothetical protein
VRSRENLVRELRNVGFVEVYLGEGAEKKLYPATCWGVRRPFWTPKRTSRRVFRLLVGPPGFEPGTPCTPSR